MMSRREFARWLWCFSYRILFFIYQRGKRRHSQVENLGEGLVEHRLPPRKLSVMGFSDRILGKKNVNGGPHIEAVSPALALAGGEVRITGSGLRPPALRRPRVRFGGVEGTVVIRSGVFLHQLRPAVATSAPRRCVSTGH